MINCYTRDGLVFSAPTSDYGTPHFAFVVVCTDWQKRGYTVHYRVPAVYAIQDVYIVIVR